MTPQERRAALIAEAQRRGLQAPGATFAEGMTPQDPRAALFDSPEQRLRPRPLSLGERVQDRVFAPFEPMLTAPLGRNTIAGMRDAGRAPPAPVNTADEVVVTARKPDLATRAGALAEDFGDYAGRFGDAFQAVTGVAGQIAPLAANAAVEYLPASPFVNRRGEAGRGALTVANELTIAPAVRAFNAEAAGQRAADVGDRPGAREQFRKATEEELWTLANAAGVGEAVTALRAPRALAPAFAAIPEYATGNGSRAIRPAGALDGPFSPQAPASQPVGSIADELLRLGPKTEGESAGLTAYRRMLEEERMAEIAAENAARTPAPTVGYGHANTLAARQKLDEATLRNGGTVTPPRPEPPPFEPVPVRPTPPRYGEDALQNPIPITPPARIDPVNQMRFRASDTPDRGAIFPQEGGALASEPFERMGNTPGRGNLQPQIFAGRNAQTADLAALGRAEEMTAQGASRDDIWRETGWFKGVDGQWKWEIDDSGARLTGRRAIPDMEDYDRISREMHGKSFGTLPFGDGGTLGPLRESVIGAARAEIPANAGTLGGQILHDPLFSAYPGLADLPVATGSRRGPGNGNFDGNRIWLDSQDDLSGFFHETQHAGPQRTEAGFARGGSPENANEEAISALNGRMNELVREQDTLRSIINGGNTGVDTAPYKARLEEASKEYRALIDERSALTDPAARFDAYKRLAGEVEARNVQTRQNLTAEQRRARPPWKTQDVPDDQQIVRFDSTRSASSPFTPSRPGNAPQGAPFNPVEINAGEGIARVQPLPREIPGYDRQTFKPDDGFMVTVEGPNGQTMSFPVLKSNTVENGYYLDYPRMPGRMRGEGLGTLAYRAATDEVLKRGGVVTTGNMTSPASLNVWDALARRGYDVRRNPTLKDEPFEGWLSSSDGGPNVQVRGGPQGNATRGPNETGGVGARNDLPYSASGRGGMDPAQKQANDWLTLAGSPETALKWADEEIQFFRSMGDTETAATMEAARDRIRLMSGTGGGGSVNSGGRSPFTREGNAARGAPQPLLPQASAANDRSLQSRLTPEPGNLPRNPRATPIERTFAQEDEALTALGNDNFRGWEDWHSGITDGLPVPDSELAAANIDSLRAQGAFRPQAPTTSPRPVAMEGGGAGGAPRSPGALQVITNIAPNPYENVAMIDGMTPQSRMAELRQMVEDAGGGAQGEAETIRTLRAFVNARSPGEPRYFINRADIQAIESGAYKAPTSTVESVRPRNLGTLPGDDGIFSGEAPRNGQGRAGRGALGADNAGMGDDWFHGTPDARNIRERGFEQRKRDHSYISDTARWSELQNEMDAARAAGDEAKYFALLEEVGKLRAIEPDVPRALYITNNRGMAKTYADPQRAWDFQGAEPDVIPVRHTLRNPLNVNAGGARFSALPIDKIRAGIPPARHAEFDAIVAAYADPTLVAKGKLRTEDLEVVSYKMGFDGFEVRNTIDDYNATGKPGTVRAVFDAPSVARSDAPRGSNLSGNSGRLAPEDPEGIFSPASPRNGQTPGALDMSTEARMARAREMGFDTETRLYHGTGKDLDRFNPGVRGNGTERRTYLTDDPEIADIYANSPNYGLRGGGNPTIYPVFAKAKKPLIVSDKGPDGSSGWVSDNLAKALGVEQPPPGKYASLYEEAKRQGYDQVQIREMSDLGGPQTQYIPLDPSNIRSVHAAFDPARRDSPDLLAGLSGLGVAATGGALALGMSPEAEAGSAVTSDQIQPFPENVDAQQGSWANVPAQRVTLDDGSSAIIKIWDSGDGTYLNVLMRGNRDGSTDTLGVVPANTGYPDPEALTAPGGYSAGNADRGGLQSPSRSLVTTPEEDGDGLWRSLVPAAAAIGGAVAGRYGARHFAPELRDLSRVRASEMLADMSAAPRPYDVLMRPAASGVVRSTPEAFTAATGLAGQTLGGAAGGALGALATDQGENALPFALAGGAGALVAPAAIRAGREGLEIARDGGREFGSAFRQFSRDTRERLTPPPKPESAAAIRRAQPDVPPGPPVVPDSIFAPMSESTAAQAATANPALEALPPTRSIGGRTITDRAGALDSPRGTVRPHFAATKAKGGYTPAEVADVADMVGAEAGRTRAATVANINKALKGMSPEARADAIKRLRDAGLASVLIGITGAGALSEDGPFAPMAR